MDAEQEQLERDIMRQRMRLGDDVDALTQKVSPGQAAKRGLGRVGGRVTAAKNRVMGHNGTTQAAKDKAAGLGHSVADSASTAHDKIADSASTAQDKLTGAKDATADKIEGNPLAVGLIAFGVGWLASSLIPASAAEQRAGAALKEKAAGPVHQLGEQAKEVGEHLREPAKEAAGRVQESATGAAQDVRDRAAGHADDLAGEARERAGTVRETAQN